MCCCRYRLLKKRCSISSTRMKSRFFSWLQTSVFFQPNTSFVQDLLATADREMLRLKSLEGSDRCCPQPQPGNQKRRNAACSTALALLSNDINSSVALCRELLGSHCCVAASVLSAADEAAAFVASHHDCVLFRSASAVTPTEEVCTGLLQLQKCLEDSEQLHSQGGAVTCVAVANSLNSCRCGVCCELSVYVS